MIELHLTGHEPLPKQSFRYAGKGRGYTDPRIKAWQLAVHWKAKEIMQDTPPLDGDLKVYIEFTRSNRIRVDLDNLSKAVCDSMNGVVYKDDKQIVDLHLVKLFDEVPGLYVRVEEL